MGQIEVRDNNWIEVPSIGLAVAKQLTHYDKSAVEQEQALRAEGLVMPTLFEGAEFVKYLLAHPENREYQKILANMQGKNSWQGENFNDFYKRDSTGTLWVSKSNGDNRQKVVEGLLETRLLVIDFTDWANKHTSQGFPAEDAKYGSSYFYRPTNNSVARLNAIPDWVNLDCIGDPDRGNADVGVRAAKRIG
jgi:hypothetical protein